MKQFILKTDRLDLVLETPESTRKRIEQYSDAEKSQLSNAWLARVEASTSPNPWVHGFNIILRQSETGIGSCGFKGPPTYDSVVEIAYAVDSEFRGRGFATEVAQAMVAYAFENEATIVRAHTLPEINASTQVLAKCGFHRLGEIIDPEDGPAWRWETKVESYRPLDS